jgi:hypothetical protein
MIQQITIRDFFAAIALHAAMTADYELGRYQAVQFAYDVADEMMKEKVREVTAKDLERRARWAAQAKDEQARKESGA